MYFNIINFLLTYWCNSIIMSEIWHYSGPGDLPQRFFFSERRILEKYSHEHLILENLIGSTAFCHNGNTFMVMSTIYCLCIIFAGCYSWDWALHILSQKSEISTRSGCMRSTLRECCPFFILFYFVLEHLL